MSNMGKSWETTEKELPETCPLCTKQVTWKWESDYQWASCCRIQMMAYDYQVEYRVYLTFNEKRKRESSRAKSTTDAPITPKRRAVGGPQ